MNVSSANELWLKITVVLKQCARILRMEQKNCKKKDVVNFFTGLILLFCFSVAFIFLNNCNCNN